jgi:hypothetical protein
MSAYNKILHIAIENGVCVDAIFNFLIFSIIFLMCFTSSLLIYNSLQNRTINYSGQLVSTN